MNKYQVWLYNLLKGNYYSYFVRANNGEEAIHIVWEQRISQMKLHMENYEIGVREVQ